MNTLIRIIMTKKENFPIEEGSREAPEQFYIKITADGPYFVYGNPPIDQEIILPNLRMERGPGLL